jgi:LmbE family N-acetylglucosaminyl deacetylase
LFAEFPGRFVVATSDAGALAARAQAAGVPVTVLGVVGGTRLRLGTLVDLDVREMAEQRAGALERALRRG